MTYVHSILFLIAVSAWVAPACPQPIPVEVFVVINNTSEDQMCAVKLGGRWSAWFKIDRAANWTLRQSTSTIKFQCALPVRHKTYSLKRGKRYNLLRDDDGSVALVVVSGARPAEPPH